MSRNEGQVQISRVSESATNPGGTSAPITSRPTTLVSAPSRLSVLQVSPRAFLAVLNGASVTHKPAVGTRVRYTLNVAAQVRFTVRRVEQGRRLLAAASRCLTGTASHHNARDTSSCRAVSL